MTPSKESGDIKEGKKIRARIHFGPCCTSILADALWRSESLERELGEKCPESHEWTSSVPPGSSAPPSIS